MKLLHFSAAKLLAASIITFCLAHVALADRLYLTNGAVIEAEEIWEDAQGVWVRQSGLTRLIERSRVRRIERGQPVAEKPAVKAEPANGNLGVTKASSADATAPAKMPATQPVWIHLVGGARVEVDEATESADGVWYRRGNLNRFIEQARVEQIVREALGENDTTLDPAGSGRAFGWTTGRANLDALIRQSGARYGVDPYLIFCVMEQESSFHARAVSHAGARGLMQLMPGTAARFGVLRPQDPAQNIAGGTRYLKQLLAQFKGRVDLVLASYNAGEGAVIKYGHRVPPYRETRNYVKRISGRYGRPGETATAVAPSSARASIEARLP